MKKTLLLPLLLFSMLSMHAQSIKPDPTLSPELQSKITKTSKRLDERKEALLKLEEKLKILQAEKEEKVKQAESSAADNEKAASKLNDDALDKRKARRAKKSADNASADSREARKAAKEIKHLEKDISALKEKIMDDEAELKALDVLPLKTQTPGV